MPTNQELEELSNLELEVYAGRIELAETPQYRKLEALFEVPVSMKVIAPPEVCEPHLYRIARALEGRHSTFAELRQKTNEALFNKQGNILGWNILSVLASGVYVGEMEDIRNYRNNSSQILYPTRGLGTKVAEINFLEN